MYRVSGAAGAGPGPSRLFFRRLQKKHTAMQSRATPATLPTAAPMATALLLLLFSADWSAEELVFAPPMAEFVLVELVLDVNDWVVDAESVVGLPVVDDDLLVTLVLLGLALFEFGVEAVEPIVVGSDRELTS